MYTRQDYFKRINDQYGHLVGDEALTAIAATLHGTLRASDVVGRYGGEEYVCMAVLQSETDAERVFERACAAVSRAGFRSAGRELSLIHI